VPKPVDVTASGRKIRRGVNLWPVGSNLLKQEVYSALKLDRPTEESGDPLPPGWCEFPAYDEGYFKGLCSEQMERVKGRRGYHVWQWRKVYERNEPLDCRCYGRAAAAIKGIDRWTDEDWRQVREALGITRASKDENTETRHGVTFRKSSFWS
jgi:phage terminase large subunit GpA-like protein